jgi:hypothetical protein
MDEETDNRPRATYRGDVTAAIGQVMGPTLAGEFLVLDEATFDPATGLTVARFRYARVEDEAAIAERLYRTAGQQ